MKNLLLALPLFALLAGCSSLGGSSETRFYSLSSESNTTVKSASHLKLGIGPIKLPHLLKRPQIVTRVNNNELQMAEQHQWAGSLKEDVTQTLTENLSQLLGTEQIEKFPWKRAFKPAYQIRVHIERLDGEPGKDINLKARWWLRSPSSGKDMLARKSTYQVASSGTDYTSYVAALSNAVAQLSNEIAQQISLRN